MQVRFQKAYLFFTLRAGQTLHLITIMVIVALIVHVTSLLLLPRYATRNAYTRLVREDPTTHVRLLDFEISTSGLVDPNVALGACPFRLGDGPVRVRTKPEAREFLSISFHSPDGTAFFGVTDKASANDELNILLVTREQLRSIEAEDDPEEPVQELRLIANATDGFVMMRTVVQRPSERLAAEQRIVSIICEIDRSELPEN